MSARIALVSIIAALGVYVAMHEADLDAILSDALKASNQFIPPGTEALIHRAVFIIPPVLVGIVVFCVSSVVAMCCCQPSFSSSEAVPVGIPVAYDHHASTTPYTEYPGASVPISHWADGLCSCFNDCKVCMVGTFVPCVAVSQLYDRVKSPGACVYLFGAFTAAAFFVSWAHCDTVKCEASRGGGLRCEPPLASSDGHGMLCKIAGAASSMSTLAMVVLLMLVRGTVRAQQRIPPTCCGDAMDDCCIAFWCLPLSACQLLRHLNITEGRQYKVASADGAATQWV